MLRGSIGLSYNGRTGVRTYKAICRGRFVLNNCPTCLRSCRRRWSHRRGKASCWTGWHRTRAYLSNTNPGSIFCVFLWCVFWYCIFLLRIFICHCFYQGFKTRTDIRNLGVAIFGRKTTMSLPRAIPRVMGSLPRALPRSWWWAFLEPYLEWWWAFLETYLDLYCEPAWSLT